jgi:hypothetical protein
MYNYKRYRVPNSHRHSQSRLRLEASKERQHIAKSTPLLSCPSLSSFMRDFDVVRRQACRPPVHHFSCCVCSDARVSAGLSELIVSEPGGGGGRRDVRLQLLTLSCPGMAGDTYDTEVVSARIQDYCCSETRECPSRDITRGALREWGNLVLRVRVKKCDWWTISRADNGLSSHAANGNFWRQSITSDELHLGSGRRFCKKHRPYPRTGGLYHYLSFSFKPGTCREAPSQRPKNSRGRREA